jgi:mRNA interferase MazF
MQAHVVKLPTILVIPLTTQLEALRFTGTVIVEPDATNKLPRRSVALVFQLGAIDRRRMESQIGTLSSGKLEEVLSALDALMGRPYDPS